METTTAILDSEERLTGKERDADVVLRFQGGDTIIEIGAFYGVSRQVIHVILKRNGITRAQGGARVRGKRTEQRRAEVKVEAALLREQRRDALCLEIYGCTLAEAERCNDGKAVRCGTTMEKGPAYRYFNIRRAHLNRQEAWALSFPDWLDFWKANGLWNATEGRQQAGWALVRIDETLPFAVGNLKIVREGSWLKKAQKPRDREALCQRAFGCAVAEAEALNMGLPLPIGTQEDFDHRSPAARFLNAKRARLRDGVKWRLSFPEWIATWRVGGHWNEEVGAQALGWTLDRHDLAKPFEAGNVVVRRYLRESRAHS